MHKIQNTCRILSNENVCPAFYRLTLDAPWIARHARPGQFIHVRTTETLQPFFRRPFSIHRADKRVEIFYDVVGRGTEILASKKKGDVLDVLGPLGNAFAAPPKGTKQVVMIAGGIGAAPFLFLSDRLDPKKYDMLLLYGARTRAHVFNFKEYKQNGCKVFISTDDGTSGVKGLVSELFSKIKTDPAKTFLYACGPEPMTAAVQDFARKFQLKGQASLEAVMACGLGACLGCSKKTTAGYKTVCYDGPVFDLGEVIF